MTETQYEAAIKFANELNEVSIGLSLWAHKLAREGFSVAEMKKKLRDAMEIAAR